MRIKSFISIVGLRTATGGVILFISLYLTSLSNYLLFHSFAELICIIIAVSIFMLAWNTKQLLDNHYLMVLGIGLFFAGGLDLVHMLTYKGMYIIPGIDANVPTQLWIAARYLQSISFLIAPIYLYKKLNINRTVFAYLVIFLLILISIFLWKNFPVCYIEGVGLTNFKINSEYIISLILLGSIIFLINSRDKFEKEILGLIIFSTASAIISELSFTTYMGVYDFSNLVGHFFKILSFYFIYQVIIEQGVRKPFGFLFRNIKKSSDALLESHIDLERRVQNRTSELSETNILLEKENNQRKKVEERLHIQLQNLAALREIDNTISAGLDLKYTIMVILDQISSKLDVDAVSLLLFNKDSQKLEFVEGKGFQKEMIKHTSLKIGEGEAGRSLSEQKNIHILNLNDINPPFIRESLIEKEGFINYHCTPLIVKEKGIGVLELFNRTSKIYNQEWNGFLKAFGVQTAIAIENATLFDNIQKANIELELTYNKTLKGWVKALSYKDEETEEHSQRVTNMTVKLARLMCISENEIVHLRRGAILHDIGKMAIPDKILLNQGELTKEEWIIMKKHPQYAYEWLSKIDYLVPALDIPYCHHEKWDGTGYPRGLKGEEIPIAARIFSVIDVWDALHSDRSYRSAWASDNVLEYIKEQNNKHFDPIVIEKFLKYLPELNSKEDELILDLY